MRIYKETKKVRAIGGSNFTVAHIETLIEATGVVPAMNQIECHPSLIQPELFKYCEWQVEQNSVSQVAERCDTGKEKNIIDNAYSPLGNNTTGKPRVIDASEFKQIAQKLGKELAQVLIAWCVHQGFAVIPKL